MIKLTSIYKDHKGQIHESEVYVNPIHIKSFHSDFDEDWKLRHTFIYWSIGGHNSSYVKETPEQIVELINKTK